MKKSLSVIILSATILGSYVSGSMVSSVSAASAVTNQQTASIVASVNLRDAPSLSSKVVANLKKGAQVTIVDQTNSYYYKVRTSSGQTGYVSKSDKYIKLSASKPSTPITDNNNNNNGSNTDSSSQVNNSVSAKIQRVIDTGRTYMGTPYEFGSNRNTTTTFDCSDFVRQIYKEATGIVLPSDSRKQGSWVQEHSQVVYDKSKLKAGDLVFFMSYKGSSASAYANINKSTERITHVAMYIGNGKIMQTYSIASGGVRIDDLSGSWERRMLYGGSVLSE